MNMQEQFVENIFSKIEKNLLLHQLIKPGTFEKSRLNITPCEQSLQAAYIKLEKDKTFKPHKHIFFERNMPIAQESWVVIQGEVLVIYYDLDDQILCERIIKQGEATITYRGGHNYRSLKEDTRVFEYKTGPYLGIEKDKVFIN